MTPRAPYRSAPFSPFAAKLLLLVTVPLPLAPAQDGIDTPWGPGAVQAFVRAARDRTLAAAAAKGITLPADFVAWVDADPVRRASVYGCRQDPLPVLLALRSLDIDLGADLVRRDHPQLAIAFAIQGSYAPPRRQASGWNDGDGEAPNGTLPDVTPRAMLQLVVPGDPRVRVDTHDPSRPPDRDDHIINFLEDHAPIEVEVTVKELPPLEYDDKGVAKPRGKAVEVKKKVTRGLVGADVIASPSLQNEFNAYLQAHGCGDVRIDCGDHQVAWNSTAAIDDQGLRQRINAAHELFHAAYRNKGRMPAERDRAPTPAESMAWFVRNDRWPFPAEQKQAREWPRFPLDAPWPVLLMLAADDQPLREREDIWQRFRDAGEFRTYGEYIGGIAQQFDMQSARRVSPFAFSYGSIQMMWKDGGVCGTMGNIGARTYRIVGVPASTAGQPGHCAIVRMEQDPKTGAYRCVGGQYATGGDEVTTVHAGWNYDDVGGRRPMVFHQSVAWGVSRDFASYVQSLVMRRLWDAEPAERRATQGVAFVQAAVQTNPFALPAVLGAIDAAADAEAALAVLDAFVATFDRFVKPGDYPLYRSTVRDLAHARARELPAPKDPDAAQRLLGRLERQGCDDARLLARTWRTIGGEAAFTEHCVAAVARYLGSPARSRSKAEAKRFAEQIEQWGRTVKGKAQKQQWAEVMLAAFAGKEALVIKKKRQLDPAVAALCKLAGREPPTVDG
ncbi:MAG: hypothetical protein IT455_05115 [Planctomycetes bacterium]|nr:hypothetical protein [Planctomycetota bacterium]